MPKLFRNNPTAFTLVELMVVITVIVIVAGIALPSAVQLIRSGAQEQAYNMLSAQLASARALAMLEATYAGVHIQPAAQQRVDDGELPEDTVYSSVVLYDRQEGYFDIPDGFDPEPLPGKMAFGEISNDFVSDNEYRNGMFGNQNDIDDFTTFTIVFAPDGSVVLNVEGRPVEFNTSEDGFFRGPDRLWDGDLANEDGEGVRAVCLFEYTDFIIRDGGGRRDLLNESGRFLPVNIHTGQVFPRQ
ncbi:MAG: pilus assembly FimT family protein [Phycisphaerae bacterium]